MGSPNAAGFAIAKAAVATLVRRSQPMLISRWIKWNGLPATVNGLNHRLASCELSAKNVVAHSPGRAGTAKTIGLNYMLVH